MNEVKRFVSSAEKGVKVPIFVVVLYVMTTIASLVLTNKIIVIHGFLISACLIVFPLIFFLGDIVAEIYGYRVTQKIIFYSLLGAAIFSVLMFGVIQIPSPNFYNNSKAYHQVFEMSMKFMVVGFFAIWIGTIVNSFMIVRWKFLVAGRYFWLRSIGSSAVGELVNSLVAFPLGFGGILTIKQIVNLLVVSYVLKLIYAIICAPIGGLIVYYIKVVKKIDYTSNTVSFNPFSALVEEDN